jgi:hypothetical protein
MFYGLFMYGYQGQYSISPSPQTVSPYWALVVANLFYILSGTIAAVLYGNIGLKGEAILSTVRSKIQLTHRPSYLQQHRR